MKNNLPPRNKKGPALDFGEPHRSQALDMTGMFDAICIIPCPHMGENNMTPKDKDTRRLMQMVSQMTDQDKRFLLFLMEHRTIALFWYYVLLPFDRAWNQAPYLVIGLFCMLAYALAIPHIQGMMP